MFFLHFNGWTMSRYAFLCSVFLGFSCYGSETDFLDSDYYPKSQTTYGGVGLIATPTARFYEDGELGFGLSTETPYNRLFAKVQFFPWMEVVVRYTEGTYKSYHGAISTSEPGFSAQTWKDKGIDIKLRIFQEGRILPELAVGLSDFGGTGAYASEYIVASKRVNNLDFTLGLGWGALGERAHIKNPFGVFSETFNKRGGRTFLGGKLNLDRVFTGESAAFFGGLEYFTPISNLSLKLEYDSNLYSDAFGQRYDVYDPSSGEFDIDSPINIALNYQFNTTERGKADFSVGFVRGNTLYANVAIHTNLNAPVKPKYQAPPEILNRPYLESFPELNSDWQKYLSELIIWQMGNEGLVTHKLIFKGNELQAEISQGRFQKPIQAIDLASRILGNNSPTNIEKITVINIDQGVETLRASIPRMVLVEQVARGPLEEEYLEFNLVETINENAIIKDNEYLYPNFYWAIAPHMTGTLQHQVKFYFWQLEALIHTEYAIKKGLYLMTDIGINIANNYEEYTWHVPDGQLHHVRQDRRLYLTEGESGLNRMALDYLIDINSNVTAKITAGYLEWMYGGIGGEVLYMPDQRHWALGADLYWVKQREFDKKFSFLDYETVTGFVNFYYDLPFYNLRFKASVGKFLGKDTGIDIDVQRRFKTGATVGAKAALTDCDPGCVGEGSFNKWIYFTMPMDLFYSKSPTRGGAGWSWSPLTKDAGQKVQPGRLYGLMRSAPDEVDSLRQKPWSIKKILSGFSTTSKKKT